MQQCIPPFPQKVRNGWGTEVFSKSRNVLERIRFAESAAERGEGFNRKRFGAGRGVDAGLRESLGYDCGIDFCGAEIVGQRFALLREGETDEADERFLHDAEFFKAGSEFPAEDGGVNLGRRSEGRGRKREELLGGAVHLRGDGEGAVVARAGFGADAVGDFALDHEHGGVEGGVALGEAKQNRRGDVVREVADDGQLLSCLGCCGGEVEAEHILLDNFHIVLRAITEMHAQAEHELMIVFDGNDAGGAGGKPLGDGAQAGTDFNRGARAQVAERGGNALDGSLVVKEVLAEFGFGGHVLYLMVADCGAWLPCAPPDGPIE